MQLRHYLRFLPAYYTGGPEIFQQFMIHLRELAAGGQEGYDKIRWVVLNDADKEDLKEYWLNYTRHLRN